MTSGLTQGTPVQVSFLQVLPAERSRNLWQHVCSDNYCLSLMGRVRGPGGEAVCAERLLTLIQQQGFRLIESLSGQFALVVASIQDRKVWLYSDRFSSQRLYYAAENGCLRVSDDVSLVARALESRPAIAQSAIIDYLFYHMIPSPRTIYEGVRSTRPAEVLAWSADDRRLPDAQRYWTPVFDERGEPNRTEEEYSEELFELLRTVAAEHAELTADTGCFLSGGLDSSSISGLVAMKKPRAKVFSIGFPLEQYNEIGYARTAVKHFNLDGHEYFMTPEDVVDALPLIAGSMPQPFGNSSVMPAYFCARLAQSQGVDHLIAGDGGDELFAGNERYAFQLKMERWKSMLSPVMPMLDMAFVKANWPAGKAGSFTRQLQMSVPERLEYYNFLNLIDRQTVFADRLADADGLLSPDRENQRIYDELEGASALSRMLYLDWKHTLADNDLEKVNSMCRLAGVGVSYPMLDNRLVDFSLRVPSRYKLTPRNLRHLFKRSMHGFLPDKIINKSKHGFGLPFGVWTAEHKQLRDLAYDSIDSLNRYDLFQPGFIDEVKRQHSEVHAKHYGELIWVLMILALWLDRHDA